MRLFLISIAALAFAAAALAGSSSTSGSASYNHPLTATFTTSSVGAVSARATWVPKGKTQYSMQLRHLTDPSDIFSYDQICIQYTGQSTTPANGDWTCTIGSGNPGFWRVDFFPTSGKADATLAVTYP